MWSRPGRWQTPALVSPERTDSRSGRGRRASAVAGSPLDRRSRAPRSLQAGRVRAGGSPGAPQRRSPTRLASVRIPASGTPGQRLGSLESPAVTSALLPALGWGSSRAHPPAPGRRPSQPQRRGRSPAQRSVCFPSPTDVSQNIGHMFSGNKLGMSANTLGLRWLFQLPHGRPGREGASTFHPAVASPPPPPESEVGLLCGSVLLSWRPGPTVSPCTRPSCVPGLV